MRQAVQEARHQQAVQQARQGQATRPGRLRQRVFHSWPLWLVLAAQTVLTVPWLWRTAPFTDEALYLQAGHQEWAHWLHHAALPFYGFSGAPVFYPPLGAEADSLGGLAAARGLSLMLMLGATIFLYFTAILLFGRRDAFFAAALFAVCGLVVHYGAFATYDPLALFLLTLGTWAAVHARHGYRWMVAAAIALAAANAAKYATLGWDPVVAGIVTFHTWDQGAAKALRRGAALAVSVAALDAGLLALAGPGYVRALIITTVARNVHWGAYDSPASVLWRALMMSGFLVVTAALAVVLSIARKSPFWLSALLTLLFLAALIAPAYQAHIRQLSALDKNLGFGLPFAALAAGYGLSTCIGWAGRHMPSGEVIAGVAAVGLVLLVLVTGREQSVQFRGPNTKVAAEIVSAINAGYQRNTYIASDTAPWLERYYLPHIPPNAWLGVYKPDATQRTHFEDRISDGCISMVVFRLVGQVYRHPYDYQLHRLLQDSPDYKLVLNISTGKYSTQIWRHEAPPAAWGCQPRPWYITVGIGHQSHAPIPAIRRWWLHLKRRNSHAVTPAPTPTPGHLGGPTP